MKIKDLIKELEKYDEDADVLVWAGYNAGSVTGQFGIRVNNDNTITLQ